jgi:protein-disulfide isomerase
MGTATAIVPVEAAAAPRVSDVMLTTFASFHSRVLAGATDERLSVPLPLALVAHVTFRIPSFFGFALLGVFLYAVSASTILSFVSLRGLISMSCKAVTIFSLAIFFPVYVAVLPSAAQTPASSAPAATESAPAAAATPEQAQFLKTTEVFVRELFAWGPDIKVSLGPLGPSASPNFYAVPLKVTLNDQSESGEVYVSKDGKTLLRGEIFDMSVDPYAANRAKIHIDGSPSKGPADASVTLVEFSDFQCPHCHELWEEMRIIEPRYPQIRIVYKDFPLTQIHPWAQTAALGGHCAFDQSPAAFWKMEDSIFDQQDVISPENVWGKLTGFATQAGLNADTFKACLSSPDAQKAIDASHDEGVALGVNSTPTVYINGRPLVGGDVATLSQYIDFELAAQKR